MSIGRYDLQCIDIDNWQMSEYDYGDYIKFDDYQDLAALYDHLQDKYDRLVQKIRNIGWEE